MNIPTPWFNITDMGLFELHASVISMTMYAANHQSMPYVKGMYIPTWFARVVE